MSLYDLYSKSKALPNLFIVEVTVKGNYTVEGFEQFGYIDTLRKGAKKDKIDVNFKKGHQLIGLPRQQVVVSE